MSAPERIETAIALAVVAGPVAALAVFSGDPGSALRRAGRNATIAASIGGAAGGAYGYFDEKESRPGRSSRHSRSLGRSRGISAQPRLGRPPRPLIQKGRPASTEVGPFSFLYLAKSQRLAKIFVNFYNTATFGLISKELRSGDEPNRHYYEEWGRHGGVGCASFDMSVITPSLAEQIVQKVRGLFDLKVQVLSPEGKIIAGGETKGPTRFPLQREGEEIGALALPARVDEALIEVIRSLAELIIQESVTLEDSQSRDEQIDKFVFDLIMLSEPESRELRDRSELLGIDLAIPRLCMVAMIEGVEEEAEEDREFTIERTKRSLARCLASFYTRSPVNEVAYLGGKVFLILKDIGSREGDDSEAVEAFKKTLPTIYQIFRSDFGSSLSVGVGNYHQGISGLRLSFKEAKTAVDLGRQMVGPGRIHHIDDFGVVAGILSGFEGMPRRSGDLVSQLRSDQDTARTLSIFFDSNLSLTETSQRLGIHRNTLVYRLEKITTTLGLDPRRFEEAVQIKLALLMQRFEEEG